MEFIKTLLYNKDNKFVKLLLDYYVVDDYYSGGHRMLRFCKYNDCKEYMKMFLGRDDELINLYNNNHKLQIKKGCDLIIVNTDWKEGAINSGEKSLYYLVEKYGANSVMLYDDDGIFHVTNNGVMFTDLSENDLVIFSDSKAFGYGAMNKYYFTALYDKHKSIYKLDMHAKTCELVTKLPYPGKILGVNKYYTIFNDDNFVYIWSNIENCLVPHYCIGFSVHTVSVFNSDEKLIVYSYTKKLKTHDIDKTAMYDFSDGCIKDISNNIVNFNRSDCRLTSVVLNSELGIALIEIAGRVDVYKI